MEFYKQAKVLGLTANTTLNLDSAVYNHKGVSILTDSSTQVMVKFYDNVAGGVGRGLTLAVTDSPNTANLGSTKIIPARFARITSNSTGVTLIFWN